MGQFFCTKNENIDFEKEKFNARFGECFFNLKAFNKLFITSESWQSLRVFVYIKRPINFESHMTSLLTHTVAHSTRPSFRPKTNNQPLKKFLSLAVSWVRVVKNFKILTFKVNFLCQKLSESLKKNHWRISF